MFISIVIPVRNEERHIGEVLNALIAQNYDKNNYEILVVDGMSTDKTREIVQQTADISTPLLIRLLENPKRLSSAARNIGVQNANGDAVLIVDGHCIIDNPDMLANAAKAFETEQTAASGSVKPDVLARPQPLEMKDATPLQWAIASARRSKLGHNPGSFIYSDEAQWCPASSAGIAYRKEVFDKAGYFDETFDACEDAEFNTRCDKAGLKCWFTPDIAVSYVPRNSLSGLFYQMMRYGKGRVKLFRKHPETFSLSMFGLGFFVFCVIAGYILISALGIGYIVADFQTMSQITAYYTRIYSSMLLLYFSAVLFESLRLTLCYSRNTAVMVYLPVVFISVHFGFGCGILRELLFGKRFDKMTTEKKKQ